MLILQAEFLCLFTDNVTLESQFPAMLTSADQTASRPVARLPRSISHLPDSTSMLQLVQKTQEVGLAKQLAIKQILEHAIASRTEVEQRCSANMANCSLSELIACLNTHHELYASALQAAPDCEKSKNEIVHELISQSERALPADWAEVPSTYTI